MSSYSSFQRPVTEYAAVMHDIQDGLVARDPARQRGRRETDPRAQIEDVDLAELLAEDRRLAG